MTSQAEQQFEARLTVLLRDSTQCAIYGYTEFALHFTAGHDFAVIDRLNQHPAFWNAILGALQTSAMVALGRIFDRRADTYSALRLLTYAEEYRGIFSRSALEARMVHAGMPAADAKAYAAGAHELPPDGLNEVRRQFEDRRKFFDEKVKPIRHDVFAHAGGLSVAERDALFGGLPMRKLEDLIVFPLRLARALFRLYHDGREPVLNPAPSLMHEVLEAKPEPGETWEHLHAAANAARFLDWLRGTPLEEK